MGIKIITYKNKELEVSEAVCMGRNYVEHIEEFGNEVSSSMVVFNKPDSGISDRLYYFSEVYRFEGETCL